MTFFILILLFFSVLSNPTSIKAFGTTLPPLSYASNYRIFNDLMKQSLPMVMYQVVSYGIIRCYNVCPLSLINNLTHQYPSSLLNNTYGAAEIPFFGSSDNNFLNQTFRISYSGTGKIGVFQQGLINQTWSNGTGGTFVLPSISVSLWVYIYNTTAADPVTNIQITLASLGNNVPTYTSNFISYLKPFTMLRTCYWQGQRINTSGFKSQIWNNRTLKTSSTQISSTGVALQHILELQNYNVSLWACVPDTADTNYITQMATMFANTRNQTKTLYMEYGNVFTIMNQVPDQFTNPSFTTFMQVYGQIFRPYVIFTINYLNTQYYINAMGSQRSPPINYTYIDAIGFPGDFGLIDATVGYGLSDSDLKKLIINTELTYQTTVNIAYQVSKMNGTDFVMYSGGPYLKTPVYGWNFLYSKNQSNQTLKTLADQQTSLYNTLLNMTLKDPWVQQLYLHWIARLTSMGIKTIFYSQLIGSFSTSTDIVPLLSDLSSTTQIYNVLKDYSLNGRVTTLPTSGVIPPNPFTCTPSCVWGDCINNLCSCYIGYSGNDCSIYSPPNVQNKIGMNLQGISYWTTQNPFIDMHRSGSDWIYFIINGGWSSGSAYQSQVPLDANGYPTYLPPGITVGTLMARDINTHYDKGTYIVLYDGDGILTFGLFDVIAVRYGIGRIQVDVVPSTNFNNGLVVVITRTNPNNYVRNIRVIRPGYEAIWRSAIYSPYLIQKIKPFGTLRFMDWTNTNGQTDVQWSNRTLSSQRTYTKNGAAWQQVIKLSNTLGKNAWINIPHLASNEYIRRLAQLFNSTLQPHLKVYVEYSNQVWGTLFPGGQYAQNMGVKLNYSVNDPTQARFCFLGQRTQDIYDIWTEIYGLNNPRINIIVSTQAVNADTTKRILACRNTYTKVHGVAIAPYLSVPIAKNATSDILFAQLNNQLTLLGPMVASHLNFTNSYGLPLLCYQSGQGLEGTDAATTKLQVDAQFDVKMRLIYRSYLQILFNNSIVLANHYCDSSHYGTYGSWGLFQYTDDNLIHSQKWLGVLDYITDRNLSTGAQKYASCNLSCNYGTCAYGKCNCYSGYTGSDCSTINYIDYVNCGYLCSFNQGVCKLNRIQGFFNRYFQCTCNPGYTGFQCAIPICKSQCSYAGKCVAPQTCSCFRGRMGVNCEIDCGCNGHGTCNPDKTCRCDPGFNYNNTSKKCQFSCFGKDSVNCYGPKLLSCPGCTNGVCKNGTCKCWPGYKGTTCNILTTINYIQPNLGINVGGLSYWSTQHLFKDYFKQSSYWVSLYYPGYFNGSIAYTWNTGQSFPTLPNGYPASLYENMTVAKLLLRDIKGRYPKINQTNQYVLLYDGDGVIQMGMDAKTTQTAAGRIKFYVVPSNVRDNGVYMVLLKTNPANPVQNIRVLLAQDQYTYNQDILTWNFMKFISQFSTIRFMDLLSTNGNPISQWNQTTLPDQHTQASSSGISIDLLAKIVNRTGRNVWINIPHLASDDYVNKLATFLQNNIPSNRIIFVQYSNEVWNSFFEQGKYAISQASKLGLGNAHKFYGVRSLKIFNIFSSVFGNGSPRLKFVISYQAVNRWVADQILTTTLLVNGKNISLSSVVNVIASAPYYDCNGIGDSVNTAIVATLNPKYVISTCNSQFSSLFPFLQTNNNVSITYGNISIAAYQAGTSISQQQTIYSGSENAAATANFIRANQDPEMYGVYKNLLYYYKQYNFSKTAPLMIFSSIGLPSKYGSWGILDYLDQINESPTHPKFQAVLDFNQGK